ncbi:hypothetical protein D3C85_1569990 [compost metagenome]
MRRLHRLQPLPDLIEQLANTRCPIRRLGLEQLLLVRFAFCVVAQHFTQLLYIVHCGVPLIGAVLRRLSMADARRTRTTKRVSGTSG